MSWLIIFEIAYILLVVAFCLRVIYDTQDAPKTLAYLMLIIFIPVVGMVVYMSVGMNFRKRNIFRKKARHDEAAYAELHQRISLKKDEVLQESRPEVNLAMPLINLLVNDGPNPITTLNKVDLLLNGEEKFPEMFSAIRDAKYHVHIAYYIIDFDHTGTELLNLLEEKARQGVDVRLLYDDFGSKPVRGAYAARLVAAGGEAVPFNKIKLLALASKINYRNHRKIAVIDGGIGFIGGVNISDKYINTGAEGKLYWRDTHLKIEGHAVQHLQYIFLNDWNFSTGQQLTYAGLHRPDFSGLDGNVPVQVVAGGPDCPRSIVKLSMLKAIHLAKESVYITTPYFIPDGAIVSALKVAALSGVDVRMLVPEKGDSFTVNAAAKSYYLELLKAGISVYLYQKGFVHAKTMVIDHDIAIVGTANMDIRSFDINFEVNAHVYETGIARQLSEAFLIDIQDACQLDYQSWSRRPWTNVLPERISRLFSPLL